MGSRTHSTHSLSTNTRVTGKVHRPRAGKSHSLSRRSVALSEGSSFSLTVSPSDYMMMLPQSQTLEGTSWRHNLLGRQSQIGKLLMIWFTCRPLNRERSSPSESFPNLRKSLESDRVSIASASFATSGKHFKVVYWSQLTKSQLNQP